METPEIHPLFANTHSRGSSQKLQQQGVDGSGMFKHGDVPTVFEDVHAGVGEAFCGDLGVRYRHNGVLTPPDDQNRVRDGGQTLDMHAPEAALLPPQIDSGTRDPQKGFQRAGLRRHLIVTIDLLIGDHVGIVDRHSGGDGGAQAAWA